MNEIPLSFLTSKQKGPRRDSEGRLLSRTLLGATEDYVAFKKEQGDDEDDRIAEALQAEREKDDYEKWVKKVERLKRKEEKEKQKRLQSMMVFEQTKFLKQEKAMLRWNEMNLTWDRVKKNIAKKTGKVNYLYYLISCRL